MSDAETTEVTNTDSVFWTDHNLRILKLMLEGRSIKLIASDLKKPVKEINDIITNPIFLQKFTGYTDALANIFEQTQSRLLNELTNLLMKKVKKHLKDLKPQQALTELGKLLALQKSEKVAMWGKKKMEEPPTATKGIKTVEEMFGFKSKN